MDITPQVPSAIQRIQSYGLGGFRINGAIYTRPVIVCAEDVHEWNCDAESPLMPTKEIAVLAGKIDVLLIGCSQGTKPLSPAQRQQFSTLGFTCDVMDTPAAARTYNVLITEGRRVAAALIPIS